MTDWISALADVTSSGRPAVLVTVLRAEGSTPRDAATKMVVWEEAFHGSVGGGHLELEALGIARELLSSAGLRTDGEAVQPLIREFALGPALGQCCGGRTTLLFEAILPIRWHVAVFGAGHVGKAVVQLLAALPCRVSWIDSREEELPLDVPERVQRIVVDPPEDVVEDLPAGADVLVMTHSHAIDLQIVDAALKRGAGGYLGLIGSETKRARFVARLAQRGHSPQALARLTCPIGLKGIRGKLPAEIAIAVVAQLLQLRGTIARSDVTALDIGRDADPLGEECAP